MERKKVTVYVRKGGHDSERTLSFKRLPEIPTADVLKADISIDGNSFLLSVGPCFDDDDSGPLLLRGPDFRVDLRSGIHYGLANALAATEKALVAWLDGYGYDVEFA